MVLRVSPKMTIHRVLQQICAEADLDAGDYEVRDSRAPRIPLDKRRSLMDYELTEVQLIRVVKRGDEERKERIQVGTALAKASRMNTSPATARDNGYGVLKMNLPEECAVNSSGSGKKIKSVLSNVFRSPWGKKRAEQSRKEKREGQQVSWENEVKCKELREYLLIDSPHTRTQPPDSQKTPSALTSVAYNFFPPLTHPI